MSYRKDQGRYARMLSFWAILLLAAYGCFHSGGLVSVLDRYMGESNPVLIDPFPLLGRLRVSTCIVLGLMLLVGIVTYASLHRPKIADVLIDTELEMQKVTWPTWGEAWQGTMAVTIMVVVLFLFLSVVDLLLLKAMQMLTGGGAA
ncbi:MAG: preprotein translocase subunit SecE [Planctomycetes bacterium]|nr:preprotein translocase subunit SecE [Planctomycetota bacterium]